MTRLAILCLLFIWGCSSSLDVPHQLENESNFVEIRDLYTAGHEKLQTVIDSNAAVGTMLDSQLVATLLITLTIEYEDGIKERVQQSGCFIANGAYILTAGHGFFVDDGTLISLEGHTIARQKVDLAIVALGYSKDKSSHEDWAILQQVNPRRTKALSIARSHSKEQETYVLGYPGGMALNDSNQVVHAMEVDHGSTYPLVLICERSPTRPHILLPRVGALPIQGMSGAPVLTVDGKLRGLFSSISRNRGSAGWQYVFHMSDLPLLALDSLMKN